jgi:hypothetical protein
VRSNGSALQCNGVEALEPKFLLVVLEIQLRRAVSPIPIVPSAESRFLHVPGGGGILSPKISSADVDILERWLVNPTPHRPFTGVPFLSARGASSFMSMERFLGASGAESSENGALPAAD